MAPRPATSARRRSVLGPSNWQAAAIRARLSSLAGSVAGSGVATEPCALVNRSRLLTLRHPDRPLQAGHSPRTRAPKRQSFTCHRSSNCRRASSGSANGRRAGEAARTTSATTSGEMERSNRRWTPCARRTVSSRSTIPASSSHASKAYRRFRCECGSRLTPCHKVCGITSLASTLGAKPCQDACKINVRHCRPAVRPRCLECRQAGTNRLCHLRGLPN